MECGLGGKDAPPCSIDGELLQPESQRPRPPVFVQDRAMAARHLPFLETNWEVTPASNVAKTGLWSLVMMSLVLPVGEGRHFSAGKEKPFWANQGWQTHGRNQPLLTEASRRFMVSHLPFP